MGHYRVLRFMQRGGAQRTTATTAKVVDEAEWDIGPEARAAWGVTPAVSLSPGPKAPLIHVTRDDSYLPFVFDRGTPDTADRPQFGGEPEPEPARRRIFRKGSEVKHEVSPVEVASNEPEKNGSKTESDKKASGSPNTMKAQPRSISGPRKTNDAQVTNKPGIRRHRLEEFLKPSGPPSAGFLKPAGVSSASGTSIKRTRGDNIATTRGKMARTK
ncbi:unnamed protein product [Rhizoctonia solani]|uniref:Uncharacterized protein n=1 Tax=Rhizoctonia solani TaxID=456999 RepID=A0A8H3BCC2_9AGAM|nr:unnamed protein product [Rhizoctonia solani]